MRNSRYRWGVRVNLFFGYLTLSCPFHNSQKEKKMDESTRKNEKPDQMEMLKNVSLFSYLDDDEIRMLSDISTERTYPKNRIVIFEGDTATSLYVICSGKANAVSISPEGRQIILNTFGPGDYFGEMSFIDGEPRCATVEAREISRMLIIPRDRFSHAFFSNPDISFRLMKGLVRKLRRATLQIGDLVFKDVYGRVARLLMEHSVPSGEKLMIKEKLTHQDIADMVGASREMVSRILGELSNGEFIRIEKKSKIMTIEKRLPFSW